MEPSAGTGQGRRRLLDRLAIGLLVGVVAISVGGVALLTVYFDRLGDAVDGLQREESLPSYAGRPTAVSVDGVSAVNYLLMTTQQNGTLEAVVIAHLSVSRRDLTLIALPSDLLADNGSVRTTLAASFAHDPLLTARAVEGVTGARMDHQLRVDLDGFGQVVDSLGGITLDSESLDGDQLVSYLDDAPNPLERSVRTADLLRAALARASLGVAIADPNRFDKVMNALTPCLTVDADLTSAEIRETMVESRVRANSVVTWPLQSWASAAGAVADPVALDRLRDALASDVFTGPVPTTGIGAATVRPRPATTVPTTASGSSAWSTPSSRTTPTTSPTTSPDASPGVRTSATPSPSGSR
ncbi:MAG: LCP family protein [Propionibacteriaceae bacterium]|nr:LCP family protein [Propionibacteriaceae bacterium]